MAKFTTAVALLPASKRRLWLVLDADSLEPMPEARDFAMYLSGAGRSDNTLRTYVPRICMFLNWAHESGVEWRRVTLPQMARFKWALEAPPESDPKEGGSSSSSRSPLGQGSLLGRARSTRPRGPKTVNLTITAVLEFLRYCNRRGWVDAVVVDRLVVPRRIGFVPPGFDPGENGQFRFKRVKELRAREEEEPPPTLTEEQVAATISATRSARDRFMIALLNGTGLRVGEALGLRRSDIHFLPDSTALGCELPGAHVHVRRRDDNENFAFAKSRYGRHVPVLPDVVRAYRDYVVERDELVGALGSDHVFVNLRAGSVGAPLRYSAVIAMFRKVGARAQVPNLHPHVYRHTAATRWRRAGAELEVLQKLLGHSSPKSTEIYMHALPEDLRGSVEAAAAHLKKYAQDEQ